MKYLILLLLVPTLSFAQGLTRSESVVVRDAKFKPIIKKMPLQYLTSTAGFDGEYFRVVDGISEEPIKFTDSYEKVLRAATAYYHANKARDYFVNTLKSSYVANLAKVTLRIDITRTFDDQGHYANINVKPKYNNALTVPAGEGMPDKGVMPWNMEIWFAQARKTHISELKVKGDFNQWHQILSAYRNQTHMTSMQRFLTQLTQSWSGNDAPDENGTSTGGDSVFGWDNIIRVAGASVLMELAFRFADPLTKALSPKWFHNDTALVPEIVYHEFAHVALSENLEVTHSSPVIEGMADFFAGEIAQSAELATHIKDYNTFNGKNAKRKQQFALEFETNEWANNDFVFGMLWDLKALLGDSVAPKFVYKLRQKIDTSSSIRGQFIEGILKTCKETCAEPFVDRLKILQRYNARGI